MTRDEFERIKANAAEAQRGPSRADIVMVCVRKGTSSIIHPDELGPQNAALFKRRCEAIAEANRDRKALLDFIEEGFEIEWPEASAAPGITRALGEG